MADCCAEYEAHINMITYSSSIYEGRSSTHTLERSLCIHSVRIWTFAWMCMCCHRREKQGGHPLPVSLLFVAQLLYIHDSSSVLSLRIYFLLRLLCMLKWYEVYMYFVPVQQSRTIMLLYRYLKRRRHTAVSERLCCVCLLSYSKSNKHIPVYGYRQNSQQFELPHGLQHTKRPNRLTRATIAFVPAGATISLPSMVHTVVS